MEVRRMNTFARRAIVPLSIVFLLASAASGALAANGTISNGGARVIINFANTFDDNVLFTGELPAIQNVVLQDMSVDVNLGGLRRQYVLDANGQSIDKANFFEIRD